MKMLRKIGWLFSKFSGIELFSIGIFVVFSFAILLPLASSLLKSDNPDPVQLLALLIILFGLFPLIFFAFFGERIDDYVFLRRKTRQEKLKNRLICKKKEVNHE